MRLFVAINLPETEKRRLGDHVTALSKHPLPVRWTATDALHITLKFLGDVPPAQVGRVRAALHSAVAEHPAFDVAIDQIGAFPSLSRPSIFWVGVSCPRELADLQAAIEVACAEIGFAREARAFRPHITIGRLKKDGVIRDPAAMDRIAAEFRYNGAMRVSVVNLMQSQLGPRGARYEVVDRMELN